MSEPPVFKEPSRGGSLSEAAYRSIRHRIVIGEIRPGEALSETELARDLGISRTPVREAFQQLAREGIVEILRKRGTFAAQPSLTDVRDSFEVRKAIEGFAARLAAERRTVKHLELMRAALDSLEINDSYNQGYHFHAAVVEAAGNAQLEHLFLSTEGRMELINRLATRDRSDEPDTTHHAILEAIESQDADRAQAAMSEHLEEHANKLFRRLLREIGSSSRTLDR